MRMIYLFIFCTALAGHFSAHAADLFGYDQEYTPDTLMTSDRITNAVEAAHRTSTGKTRISAEEIFARAQRSVPQLPTQIRVQSNPAGVFSITQADINKASATGVNGYVINRPGTYRLCGDVDWRNKFANGFAITIASDYVDLDLNGFHIIQNDTSLPGNFHIQVAPNTCYVSIYNGVLQQGSGGGIFVKEGACCITVDSIRVEKSCYNGGIFLGEFNAGTNNLTAGILIFGAQPNIAELNPPTPYNPLAFISPNPVHDVLVTNCTFCDLGLLDGMFITDCIIAGVGTGWSNTIIVQNITAERVFSEFQASPLSFSFGNDVIVSNASLSDISSLVSVMAVYIDVFKGAIVEDVTVTNILVTVKDTPNYPFSRGAEGSKIGATQDVIMRRCSFEDISLVNEVPSQTPGIARASAVSLDGASYVTILDCVCKNVSNTDGWAYGFGSNPDGFFPFCGFPPAPPIPGCPPIAWPDRLFSNIFAKCRVQNVSVSGATSNYAAGFTLVFRDGQVVKCTVSDIHDERANPEAYGIILSLNPNKPDSTAINCIIANNRISNCDTFGIFDDTLAVVPATNNIIHSNYAYKNGASGNFNYSVNTAVTPIRIWRQAVSLPDPVDNNGVLDCSLDNIDVRNT